MATKLHMLPSGPLQTNAYLLTSAGRGEAVLIDAPEGIQARIGPLLREEDCRLTDLLLTHGHWDHIASAAELVRLHGARVRAHADDRVFFETPQVMADFFYWVTHMEPVKIDHWVTQGERFEAAGLGFEVRHVPGHAPGNVAYYAAAAGAVFTGDSLFAGAVGRSDFPGCSHEVLVRSIREQLFSLPDGTSVYPGHGPATSIGVEKRGNPYVSG